MMNLATCLKVIVAYDAASTHFLKWSIATSTYSCPPIPLGVVVTMMSISQAEKGDGEVNVKRKEGG